MTFIFISSVILNLIIFFSFKKLSKIINIYDLPDKKLKLHKKKIAIIGGVILVINLSIIFLYQIFFLGDFLSIKLNQITIVELISSLFFIFSYFLLGLYDDKYNLSPNKKIFYSILIILLTIFLNENLIIKMLSISFIDKKIFFENFSYLFTIFCILILVNALNFYDGINGQSCIIFIISFSFLLLKSEINYFYLLILISILFVFILNIKNKVFLGDSGVYFLTIILSLCLIFEHNIQNNIIYADEIFFLLLLPGIDLLRLTISRLSNFKNPFFGDRNHIHHLLIKNYSILISNFILFFLSIIPLILFSYLKLSFFLVSFIFLVIYGLLIQSLKSND
tara:strand:- start:301 stop:1311 length:1011 start_codon:yes stop_codon:yes gene_type:complete